MEFEGGGLGQAAHQAKVDQGICRVFARPDPHRREVDRKGQPYYTRRDAQHHMGW